MTSWQPFDDSEYSLGANPAKPEPKDPNKEALIDAYAQKFRQEDGTPVLLGETEIRMDGAYRAVAEAKAQTMLSDDTMKEKVRIAAEDGKITQDELQALLKGNKSAPTQVTESRDIAVNENEGIVLAPTNVRSQAQDKPASSFLDGGGMMYMPTPDDLRQARLQEAFAERIHTERQDNPSIGEIIRRAFRESEANKNQVEYDRLQANLDAREPAEAMLRNPGMTSLVDEALKYDGKITQEELTALIAKSKDAKPDTSLSGQQEQGNPNKSLPNEKAATGFYLGGS